jgi:hypothetical protein
VGFSHFSPLTAAWKEEEIEKALEQETNIQTHSWQSKLKD